MCKPERIQLRRTGGWRKPPEAVVVTRSTRYGNPWAIEHTHDRTAWRIVRKRGRRKGQEALPRWSPHHITDYAAACESVCKMYRRWLFCTPSGRAVLRDAEILLTGKPLACWCPPHQACHAQVLIDILNPKETP